MYFSRVVLSRNVSSILELDILVVADVNFSLWNFLVITLNRKQLSMAHPSPSKILLCPSLYNESSTVPKYCERIIPVSITSWWRNCVYYFDRVCVSIFDKPVYISTKLCIHDKFCSKYSSVSILHIHAIDFLSIMLSLVNCI